MTGRYALHWHFMDKRRNTRLDISLPCRICSPGSGSQLLSGVTENMSRGDVLVVLEGERASAELPCVGDPLLIEIDLPANHAFGQKCMQCQATVVRVSTPDDGPASLAMRIHKMRFQSRAEAESFAQDAGMPLRQVVM
jgi:hypothetical protein